MLSAVHRAGLRQGRGLPEQIKGMVCGGAHSQEMNGYVISRYTDKESTQGGKRVCGC